MTKRIISIPIILFLSLLLWYLTGQKKVVCTGVMYTSSRTASICFQPEANNSNKVRITARKPFYITGNSNTPFDLKIVAGKNSTGFIKRLDFSYFFIPIATMHDVRIEKDLKSKGYVVVPCGKFYPRFVLMRYLIWGGGTVLLLVFLCLGVNKKFNQISWKYSYLSDCILITIFFILLLLPSIQILLPDSKLKHSTSTLENRNIKKKPPVFNWNFLKEYGIAFDTYYSENFPGRTWIIKTFSRFFNLFEYTQSTKVFYGLDGWLFYKGEIHNYLGDHRFSEPKVKAYAHYLDKIGQQLKRNNIRFIVMVVPDKTSVYSEKLPLFIKVRKKRESSSEQLIKILKDKTKYVEFYHVKKDAFVKKDKNLYYKIDTHWNYLGAYYAFYDFARFLGCEKAYLSPGSIQPDIISYKNGDLGKMLGLEQAEADWGVKGFSYFPKEKQTENNRILTAVCNNPQSSYKKAIIIHDSFMRGMHPYMVSLFSETHFWGHWADHSKVRCFFDRNKKDVSAIIKEKPQILIYEVIARDFVTKI